MYISNSSMLPFCRITVTLMHFHFSKLFNPGIVRVFIKLLTLKAGGVAFKLYVIPVKCLVRMNQKILSMVGTLCLNLMYFKVQGAREKNTKGQSESLTEPIKEPIVVCFAEKMCKFMRHHQFV